MRTRRKDPTMTRTRHQVVPGALAAIGGAALALTLAACGVGDVGEGSWSKMDEQSPSATATDTATDTGTAGSSPSGAGEHAAARSETREDSVYPQIGDPLVDALHYDLGLTWDPEKDVLTGRQTLTFRATDDADALPLDFSDELEISELTVDGKQVDHRLDGTSLSIEQPLVADQEYELALTYAGTPEPTPAPSPRPAAPAPAPAGPRPYLAEPPH